MSRENLPKNEDEWKANLSDEQYRVLREKGTERAFTGEYESCKDTGMYTCAGCGQALFNSDTKFDSGTGWPSYYSPTSPDAVTEYSDTTLDMTRTEVVCSNCEGHLGHVFPDGPDPTGQRYCINSVSLKLEK
jgi:peptide-methionine (R)-S-oxide reductase